MGFTAEYGIGCEHLPFVDVAAALPNATLEVEIAATAEEIPPLIVHVTARDIDAVERAFESSAFVTEYSVAGRTGETRRYKVRGAVGLEGLLGDHFDDVSALRALADTESVSTENRPALPTG